MEAEWKTYGRTGTIKKRKKIENQAAKRGKQTSAMPRESSAGAEKY